jgi:pimeloyl-ACP methyl ester carboxylesterase
MIQTPRLRVHALTCGPAEGVPVLFIHGNGASATFWEETMLALPAGFRAIAPDLRGYGDTEPLPVDATLGLGDMAEDALSLVDALGLDAYHVVGHSMGGGVAMKVTMARPAAVQSLTLVDTVSPYGYSGSKGLDGTPCYDDGAPAGAGSVNPEFVRLMGEKDRGMENPTSPRNVMRQFYVKPPFIPAREEELLSGMLSLRVGEDWYPGDSVPSSNWPGAAPGKRGIVNAFSRLYFDSSAMVDIEPKPPILWIRGADDNIVSNNAFWDIAALGAMDLVPGWPGAEACPPQPMIDQIRAVLDRYVANGGAYREEVIADAGHSPYLEQPEVFNRLFHAFLERNR